MSTAGARIARDPTVANGLTSRGVFIARDARSWRWLLGVLAVAVLGSASNAAVDPRDDDAQRTAQGDTLSVVTLNIYHDKADWPARRPLIIDGLKALRPDVIVLQEVLQHETLRNQAEDIAEALGFECWFVSPDPLEDVRRYGNAILTAHRILDRSAHRLEPLGDWRTLAHVRIEVGGHVVDIYGTHLHHTPEGGDIRARQVRDLMSLIAARDDGTPSLLLGDFNATVDTPELQPVLERWFDALSRFDAGAAAGTTLNPHYFEPEAQRVVDHIFAQRGRFEVVAARRILDRPDASGTWPSDHFGVYARLRFVDAADNASATP